MSVIGRMDEQVDEILIKPLSNSPHAGDRTAPASEREDASRPAPRSESPSEDETIEKDDELPVWLL
jgi:hypothetical protein